MDATTNQLPIPASLLISSDPTQALRLINNHQSNPTIYPSHQHLYSRPQPASKRLRRHSKQSNQNNQLNSINTQLNPSSPLSSERELETLIETDRAIATKLIQQDELLQLQSQPFELRPSLPILPPTPLTPLEIIKSSTLSGLFKKSNRVFCQIADSATGLIESDSNTCNKLNELVELLRGDLSSRSWIQVIEQVITPQTQEKHDDGQLHYQILTQTLETMQGLFTTPEPIIIPVITSGKLNDSSPQHKRSSAVSRPNPPPTQAEETLSQAEQLECLESCSIQLSRFLGDIQDYRDRLLEIRDGCLAIEKRRRALWNLIKICSAAFDESLSTNSAASSSLLSHSTPSSSSSSSSSEEIVAGGHPRQHQKKSTNRKTSGGKLKTQQQQQPKKKKKTKKAKATQKNGVPTQSSGSSDDQASSEPPSDSVSSIDRPKPRKKPGPKKGSTNRQPPGPKKIPQQLTQQPFDSQQPHLKNHSSNQPLLDSNPPNNSSVSSTLLPSVHPTDPSSNIHHPPTVQNDDSPFPHLKRKRKIP